MVKTRVRSTPTMWESYLIGNPFEGKMDQLFFPITWAKKNGFLIPRSETYHIPPRALPGQEVVTIKTEGCVLTLGPQRCYKYDFLNNWPSPLGDLATLTAFFGNPEK